MRKLAVFVTILFAEHPEVRDADAVDLLFERLSARFLCGGTCPETRAAMDVQATVEGDLGTRR